MTCPTNQIWNGEKCIYPPIQSNITRNETVEQKLNTTIIKVWEEVKQKTEEAKNDQQIMTRWIIAGVIVALTLMYFTLSRSKRPREQTP